MSSTASAAFPCEERGRVGAAHRFSARPAEGVLERARQSPEEIRLGPRESIPGAHVGRAREVSGSGPARDGRPRSRWNDTTARPDVISRRTSAGRRSRHDHTSASPLPSGALWVGTRSIAIVERPSGRSDARGGSGKDRSRSCAAMTSQTPAGTPSTWKEPSVWVRARFIRASDTLYTNTSAPGYRGLGSCLTIPATGGGVPQRSRGCAENRKANSKPKTQNDGSSRSVDQRAPLGGRSQRPRLPRKHPLATTCRTIARFSFKRSERIAFPGRSERGRRPSDDGPAPGSGWRRPTATP